jgi:type I restriction enzyme S subunit
MIADLKPYADYKEAGLPWLGRLPTHWDVRLVRHLGRLLKGVGGTKEDAVDDGVPCVRYGELYTTHRGFIRTTRSCISPQRSAAYTPIYFGDVLFAASGEKIEEIGKSAVNLMAKPAVCGGDVIILRPNVEVHAPFLGYALDTHHAAHQKATMGRGTTIKHIYPDELRSLALFLPPPAEQAAIVRFLDWANGRLERAIRAKRKVIALLNEQKQAIIHRAVTRGLDPSAPLKPSGIPWLGDIPAHWAVHPIRALFTEIKERGHEAEPMLSVTIKHGVITQADLLVNSIKRDSSNEDKSKYKLLLPGDIGYNKMRAWQGAFGVSAFRGIISPAYIVVRSTDLSDSQFFHFLFRTPGFAKVAESWSYGIASDMWSLRPEHFRLIEVPVPPKSEQTSIAGQLNKELAASNIAISRTEREIALIQEYRTRLVADVVTGKLDVREAAARLSDDEAQLDRPDTGDTDPDDDLATDEEADA